MKPIHEFFTNARMEDSRFGYSWFHSWMVVHFASVVARVESLRGRISAFEPRESARQASGRACRDLEGLFESLLAQTMDGGR